MHVMNQILINGHKKTQTNILIDEKLIKKMSKKYLNIIKNLKLDQIHARDELDIKNWSLQDHKQNPN